MKALLKPGFASCVGINTREGRRSVLAWRTGLTDHSGRSHHPHRLGVVKKPGGPNGVLSKNIHGGRDSYDQQQLGGKERGIWSPTLAVGADIEAQKFTHVSTNAADCEIFAIALDIDADGFSTHNFGRISDILSALCRKRSQMIRELLG